MSSPFVPIGIVLFSMIVGTLLGKKQTPLAGLESHVIVILATFLLLEWANLAFFGQPFYVTSSTGTKVMLFPPVTASPLFPPLEYIAGSIVYIVFIHLEGDIIGIFQRDKLSHGIGRVKKKMLRVNKNTPPSVIAALIDGLVDIQGSLEQRARQLEDYKRANHSRVDNMRAGLSRTLARLSHHH